MLTGNSLPLQWLGPQGASEPAGGRRALGVRHPPLRVLGCIVIAVTLAGCETLSVALTDESAEDAPERATGGGFFAALRRGDAKCSADTPEECAEQEAAQADECLRQAISKPINTSFRDAEMRRLLDCAERHYVQALRLTATEPGTSARATYHGGLLLTLSERRNRLDERAGASQMGRENARLLEAADAARAEAPENALGFVYGASARLFRATLVTDASRRCTDLREAASLLSTSPAPPDALFPEQARLSALAITELEGCTASKRVAARPEQRATLVGFGEASE